MSEEISGQLIGCTSAAKAWGAAHSMFTVENRASVRHLKRQIAALKKGDGLAATYMQQVKTLVDALAAVVSPLSDDDIIDYMLTGLDSAFSPIAASMNFAGGPVLLATFYANVLSFEAL
jgi:hypothetical protein